MVARLLAVLITLLAACSAWGQPGSWWTTHPANSTAAEQKIRLMFDQNGDWLGLNSLCGSGMTGVLSDAGRIKLACDASNMLVVSINGGAYMTIGGGGGGNVAGTPPSTDHAIARYDLTTGLIIQDTPQWTITDGGLMTGATSTVAGSTLLESTIIAAPGAPSADQWVGARGIAYNDGTDNLTTIDNLVGASGLASQRHASSTVNGAVGVSGTVSTIAAGTITNAYGGSFAVVAAGGGTISNGYGVYIDDVIASNDRALWQASSDDTNFFAGKTGFNNQTPLAQVEIVGDPTGPNVALIVEAELGGTADAIQIENGGGSDALIVTNAGITNVNPLGLAAMDFIVEGDNMSNLLATDASGDCIMMGEATSCGINVGLNLGWGSAAVRLPRVTTATRTGWTSVNAMQVYDTDLNQMMAYVGGAWVDMGMGAGGIPGGSTTQFQYNNAGAFAGAAELVINAAPAELAINDGNVDLDFRVEGNDPAATNLLRVDGGDSCVGVNEDCAGNGTLAVTGLTADTALLVTGNGSSDVATFDNGTDELLRMYDTQIVVNEDGANHDFRVEGDTDTFLLFADASAECVGIRGGCGNESLAVNHTNAAPIASEAIHGIAITTGAATGAQIGVVGTSESQGAAVAAGHVGVYGAASTTTAAGDTVALTGVQGEATMNASGTAVPTAAGGNFSVDSFAGTIDTAYGIFTEVGPPTGTITLGYGVYIADIQATTQIGIAQVGQDDLNVFSGISVFNNDSTALGDFTIRGDTDVTLFKADVSSDCVGVGLTCATGTNLAVDNLGIQFEESDTNPACAAGDYRIFADLSETTLKVCNNGVAAVIPNASVGDVVGPASVVDNTVVRFDSTTGKLIQSSEWVLEDNQSLGATVSMASADVLVDALNQANPGANDAGAWYGGDFAAIHQVSNAFDLTNSDLGLIGVRGRATAVNTAAEIVTGMVGVYGDVGTTNETVTNAYGVMADVDVSGTGTITNSYGVYIRSMDNGAGTMTNTTGVYISDILGGNNEIAIDQVGQDDFNRFDGPVFINTQGNATSDVTIQSDTNLAQLFVDAGDECVGINVDCGGTAELEVVADTANIGISVLGISGSTLIQADVAAGRGVVSVDGATGACLQLRDTDDAGWTYCTVLDGTMTCSVTPC